MGGVRVANPGKVSSMLKWSMVFKVLLVENDVSVQRMLSTYLAENGAEILVRGDGRGLMKVVNSFQPDILLLGAALPHIGGIVLLQQLRRSGVEIPVIMITGKKDLEEKVIGLELGADDYMTRPFSSRELLARITSQLRRYRMYMRVFNIGSLKIDPTAREVKCTSNEVLPLTKTEFGLLLQLARRFPQVVSHAELFTEVLGYRPNVETKALVMHIANVRRKLKTLNLAGKVQIQTVTGIGYKLVEHTHPSLRSPS